MDPGARLATRARMTITSGQVVMGEGWCAWASIPFDQQQPIGRLVTERVQPVKENCCVFIVRPRRVGYSVASHDHGALIGTCPGSAG